MKQTTKTLLGPARDAGRRRRHRRRGPLDQQGRAEEDRGEGQDEKLFDFDKAQAKEIKLSRDGQVAVRLTRAEKGWKMTQPVADRRRRTAIDTLLTALAGLKQKKDLADEKDLKAYGLDKPRLEAVVILNDGKEQGVQVGIDNSFDNTLYLKTLGDPSVRVIDGYQKASLEKTAFVCATSASPPGRWAEVKKLEVADQVSPTRWRRKARPGS